MTACLGERFDIPGLPHVRRPPPLLSPRVLPLPSTVTAGRPYTVLRVNFASAVERLRFSRLPREPGCGSAGLGGP
jgi:hypothetical protein